MRVPLEFGDRNVCVIGLGYVGLTLAATLADLGFVVRGVERNPKIMSCVRSGRAHFHETGLDARLAVHVGAGTLTVEPVIARSSLASVYIVTVGTPIRNDKTADLNSIEVVARMVAEVLKPNDLVVLRSTVQLGVTRNVVKPLLDKAQVPYDLAFCPERTLEGRALTELRLLPQVIGGINQRSCLRATQLFNFLTPTMIKVRDVETAEMIKLVNNTQRDLLFAFANEVAEICDEAGLSAIEVIQTGNIGYPRGAMPVPGLVGGPCLEKDPYLLAESAASYGARANLTVAGRKLNETLPSRTIQKLVKFLDGAGRPSPLKFAIMGLAFKGRPETSDLRGSLAVPIIAELQRIAPKATIVGYDPAVPTDDIQGLGIKAAASAREAFKGASLVIMQNNNPGFAELSLEELSGVMAPSGLIYDFWSQFDAADISLRNGVRLAGLGTWLTVGDRFAPGAVA